MGDDIEILAVELLYGGLLQVDFRCKDSDSKQRLFIEPGILFSAISEGVKEQFDREMNRRMEEVSVPCDEAVIKEDK